MLADLKTIMNLSAKDTHGHYHQFSLADVPVLIDESSFVLMAKPGSPILTLESLVCGSDMDGIYEGSILSDSEGNEYVTSFKRGFAAMNVDRQVKKLCDIDGLTICKRRLDVAHSSNFLLCRQRLLYLYDGIQFQFKDFIGIVNGMPVIKESYTPVDMNKVKQYSGLSYNNQRVYLGDEINGGIVTMHKGRICLYKDDKYIDLTDEMEVL